MKIGTILFFKTYISLFFHWVLCLVASHVIFVSNLGTVLKKLIKNKNIHNFSVFYSGENSGETCLKSNEIAADKEELYSVSSCLLFECIFINSFQFRHMVLAWLRGGKLAEWHNEIM